MVSPKSGCIVYVVLFGGCDGQTLLIIQQESTVICRFSVMSTCNAVKAARNKPAGTIKKQIFFISAIWLRIHGFIRIDLQGTDQWKEFKFRFREAFAELLRHVVQFFDTSFLHGGDEVILIFICYDQGQFAHRYTIMEGQSRIIAEVCGRVSGMRFNDYGAGRYVKLVDQVFLHLYGLIELGLIGMDIAPGNHQKRRFTRAVLTGCSLTPQHTFAA